MNLWERKCCGCTSFYRWVEKCINKYIMKETCISDSVDVISLVTGVWWSSPVLHHSDALWSWFISVSFCYEDWLPRIGFSSRLSIDEVFRSKWILATRRLDSNSCSSVVHCSRYFMEEDFDRITLNYAMFTKGIMPTVFQGFPSHLQKKIHGVGKH